VQAVPFQMNPSAQAIVGISCLQTPLSLIYPCPQIHPTPLIVKQLYDVDCVEDNNPKLKNKTNRVVILKINDNNLLSAIYLYFQIKLLSASLDEFTEKVRSIQYYYRKTC
jgi:hypothetical protein